MAKATQDISLDDIRAVVEDCMLHGSANVMRESERERGFTPIMPGDAPWLPPDVWPEDVVISLDGPRVRIVAVYTHTPGRGQFSRLITDIIRAGLVPTVIAPLGAMEDILRAWGWHRRIIGSTFDDVCDEWFPTRKWREQRLSNQDSNPSTRR